MHRSLLLGFNALLNACIVLIGRPLRFAFPDAALSKTAIIGLVPKTGFPVAAKARTAATLHQSVSSLDSPPSMISGAINPGVPITRPVRVTCDSPCPIDIPKSTKTGPVVEIIMFVGLISR